MKVLPVNEVLPIQTAIARLVEAMPAGTHLTAPEVHRHAQQAGLKVSLSTIYKVLNNLQAAGDVKTHFRERSRLWEANLHEHDHDHLICVRCNLTIEFVDELIHGVGQSVAQRKGFEHKASRFDIFGLCQNCKQKDESHRIKQAIDSLAQARLISDQIHELCQAAISYLETRRFQKANECLKTTIEKLREAINHCSDITPV